MKNIRLVTLTLFALFGFSVATPSNATVIEMDMTLGTEFYGPGGLIPALSGDGAFTGSITFDTDQAQLSNFHDNGYDSFDVDYTDLVTDYSFQLNGLGIDMGSIVGSTLHEYTHADLGCSEYGMKAVETHLSLTMSNGQFAVLNAESAIDCSFLSGLDGSNTERLTQELLPGFLLSTNSSGFVDYSTGEYYGWAGGNWSWSVKSAPEPSALALLGLGLVGLVVTRQKKA